MNNRRQKLPYLQVLGLIYEKTIMEGNVTVVE